MNARKGDSGRPRAVLRHEQSDGRIHRSSRRIPRTRRQIEDVDFVAAPGEVTRSEQRDELLQAGNVDASRAIGSKESVFTTTPVLRLLHGLAVDARGAIGKHVIRRDTAPSEQRTAVRPGAILCPRTTGKRLGRGWARSRR